MSVNGQDPRSNVYLLDGTLQNDFTNGPAGSAAGTALGIDTIREFRVEANAYSAEFGRNSGGQINVLTKSGRQHASTAALFEYHRNDALDSQQLLRRRRASRTSIATSSARTLGGPIATRPRVLLPRLRGARSSGSAGPSRTVVPDDNARTRASCRRGPVAVSPVVAPYLAEYPARQRAVARPGARHLHVPVQSAARRAFRRRGGSTTTSAPATSSSRATRSTTPTSSCRPTIRSSRGTSSRATSSSPANTAGSSRRARSTPARSASAGRGSARTSRRTRRQPLAGRSSPTRDSMGDIDIGGLQPVRAAELGQPAAGAERVQRADRSRAHPRPAHAQGGRARRALPGQHGEPDLQPRDLHLRRPARVPRQPARELRRPDARRRSSIATGASRCSASTRRTTSSSRRG